MSHSIGTAAACNPAKPEKPYPEFPLFAHATKRWAKKIKGRMHYFGAWDDWKGAYAKYEYEIPYLLQGKTPPPKAGEEGLGIAKLVNKFLAHREALVESGELAQRTWDDYQRTGELLVAELGRYRSVDSLRPDDFAELRAKISKTRGLVSLSGEIARVRAIFNFAYKTDLIDRPVKMGLDFSKPSKKSLRREAEAKPDKIFSIEELKNLYAAADKQMRTFILLGLNCGFGNSDVGQLKFRHLKGDTIEFPRPKTLIERTCPLWKETVEAIEATKQTKHLSQPFVFVTLFGASWHKDAKASPLSAEFRKLCIKCDLHQSGRGFYALRHVFRTVADGSRDRVAIDRIMGHGDASIGAHYTEWIDPQRLRAVADHVYAWVKPMFAGVKP